MRRHNDLSSKWDKPCQHGCGYIHLNSATPSMLSNCCFNGKLKFDYDSNPFSHRFGHLKPMSEDLHDFIMDNIEHMSILSSSYNNLLSIASISVSNSFMEAGVNTHRGDLN